MADLNELLVIELDAVANPPLWTGRYNVYLQLITRKRSENMVGLLERSKPGG